MDSRGTVQTVQNILPLTAGSIFWLRKILSARFMGPAATSRSVFRILEIHRGGDNH
jgi:hypothetical protein